LAQRISSAQLTIKPPAHASEAALTYVEKNLISGEQILFRTRHHWIVMLGPLVIGTLLEFAGIAALIYALWSDRLPFTANQLPPTARNLLLVLAFLLLVAGSIFTLYGVLKLNATEMLVTNKRVIVKTGIFTRRTFEMLLQRIESIGVEEPFWGRVLGFGTVILRGVGGTPDEFHIINHPLEFRSHVQQQIESTSPSRQS
jgi:uncharacterized membrane protein YdbT with pleckstrin-like domain